LRSFLAHTGAIVLACVTVLVASIASGTPATGGVQLISVRALNEPVRSVLLRVAAHDHLSMIVEPDVSGYVTCDLHSVDIDSALRAMLEPIGARFRHVGHIIIVSESPPSTAAGLAPAHLADISPVVLPLSIVRADEALRIVRTLFPQASVRRSGSANALIVVAAPSDLQAIQSVVRGIDVQDPSRPVSEGVTLHAANANELAARFGKLFPSARAMATGKRTLILTGTPIDLAQMKSLAETIDAPAATPPPVPLTSEAVRVVERSPRDIGRALARQIPHLRVAQSGSTLIISGSPEDVSRAKTLVTAIDVPPYNARITEVFAVKTIDAASVGDLVARSIPDVAVTINKDLNALSVTGTAAELQRISEAIAQLDGRTTAGGPPGPGSGAGAGGDDFELVHLRSMVPGGTSAQDVANIVTQALQTKAPDLHVIVQSGGNALLLSGSAYSIREAKRLIETIDVLPPSVALDTEVYEVDETDSKNLGLLLPSQSLSTTFSEATPPATSTGATQNFIGILPITRTELSLQVQLNLLVQRGNARVLANPRITTISGRTATIRAGDTLGIITTAGGSAGTVASSQIQSFQTGVTLEITPIVTPDGEVNVSIHPTVNSLEGVVNNVPEISTRDAQTSVHLKNNETLVIGGLIQNTTQVTENRVPGLGDLPLVGSLFRNTQKSLTNNELIIVVTPHILGMGSPSGASPTPDPMTVALPTLPPFAQLPAPRSKRGRSATLAPTPSPTPGVALTPPPAAAFPSPSPLTPAPLPTPTAFAQTNVYTYGSAPPSTYAGSGDPLVIFYATLSPTIAKQGTTIVISAITTSNATKVTFGTTTAAVSLRSLGNGKWQASFPFSSVGIDTGQSPLQIPLTAFRSDGTQTTIPIPMSVAK
jgi:type II secretory pathway component GspD/PulD (secretin)